MHATTTRPTRSSAGRRYCPAHAELLRGTRPANVGPQSTLNLYRRALELRHDLELGTAEFAWHPLSEGDQDVLAYTMSCGTGETVLVAANLGESEIGFDELSRGELLLASGQNAVVNDRLSVDSAVWLRLT